MNRFMQTLFRLMAEDITGFWVVENDADTQTKTYPDYPIHPFGPVRLISKETIKELLK